jgi:hypothetical protein
MAQHADFAAAELRQAERDEMRKVLGHLPSEEPPFDMDRTNPRLSREDKDEERDAGLFNAQFGRQ